MGGFVSGLIGAYSGALLQKERAAKDTELTEKNTRIQYLNVALSSGKLTPEAQAAALDELDEITGAKSGKGGGKSPARTIMERLIGHVSSQQQPTPFTQRVPGEGGEQAPANLGQIPQRTKGGTPNQVPSLSPIPTRPKVRTEKTATEIGQEEFEKQKPLLEYQAKQRETQDRIKAASDSAKEDAIQSGLLLRTKLDNANKITLETMRTTAQRDHDLRDEANRLAVENAKENKKAIDDLEKAARQSRAQGVNSAVTSLNQQITQSSQSLKQMQGKLDALKAQFQKQGWLSKEFGGQSAYDETAASMQREIDSAQEAYDNNKAAVEFLQQHRNAIVSGDEDFDQASMKYQAIQVEGQPQWSKSAWKAANPDGDVEAAALEAFKQGMKVVP